MSGCCVAEVGECLKRFSFALTNLGVETTPDLYQLDQVGSVEFDLPANSFVALRSVFIVLKGSSAPIVPMDIHINFASTNVTFDTTLQRCITMFADEYKDLSATYYVSDKTCDIKMKVNTDSKIFVSISWKGVYDYTLTDVTLNLDFKTE